MTGSRTSGMTILEVLVGMAILGLTVVAFLQGQAMVNDITVKRANQTSLWALEDQVRSNAFGRMRDVVMASFDKANGCRPCETSVTAGQTKGHACMPILQAFQANLVATPEGLPRYSTYLKNMPDLHAFANEYGAEKSIKDLGDRCAHTRMGGGSLALETGVYGCFNVRAVTAQEREIASRRLALKQHASLGSIPQTLVSGDDTPKSELESFLESRRVIAEMYFGFYDQARDAMVSCSDFAKLKPGERTLRLNYNLHLVEPRSAGRRPDYERIRGALVGRTDDIK